MTLILASLITMPILSYCAGGTERSSSTATTSSAQANSLGSGFGQFEEDIPTTSQQPPSTTLPAPKCEGHLVGEGNPIDDRCFMLGCRIPKNTDMTESGWENWGCTALNTYISDEEARAMSFQNGEETLSDLELVLSDCIAIPYSTSPILDYDFAYFLCSEESLLIGMDLREILGR